MKKAYAHGTTMFAGEVRSLIANQEWFFLNNWLISKMCAIPLLGETDADVVNRICNGSTEVAIEHDGNFYTPYIGFQCGNLWCQF